MRRLLHSVSYAGSWGQHKLTLDAFLGKAAALGFDGVMLMAKRPHLSILDASPAERAQVKEAIQRAGLQPVVLAGYCDLTVGLDRRDIPHREIQTHYLVSLGELARDIGAQVVRVFSGYESPHAGYHEQWTLIVETLRECARRYADLDIVLGLQNHHDIGVGFEQYLDLLEAVGHPSCRALFDAWAPALQGADLAAAAARLVPWMVHTTVADYQLRPRYRYHAAVVNYEPATPLAQAVPMGEGFIAYDAFFGALKARGYEGSVAYEMCSPLLGGGGEENLDRYARRFLDWANANL